MKLANRNGVVEKKFVVFKIAFLFFLLLFTACKSGGGDSPVDSSPPPDGGGAVTQVDSDGDGVLDDRDCAPNDSQKFQQLSGFVDADQDSIGTGSSQQVCSGNSLPNGFVTTKNTDCDDTDAAIFQNLGGFTDTDGDGHGAGASQQICSGNSLPSGFVTDNLDCDNGNADIFQALNGFVDENNDGFGTGALQQVCSGASLPIGFAVKSEAEACAGGGSPYQSGAGTVNSPFIICTKVQLLAIAQQFADWSSHFKLLANINLAGVTWTKIGGVGGNQFKGTFDGSDKTISNFDSQHVLSGDDNIGFFGVTFGATLKNLKFVNASVKGTENVGVLVGRAFHTIIERVYLTTGTSEAIIRRAGGLVGLFSGAIRESHVSNVTVTADTGAGGLAGAIFDTSQRGLDVIEESSADVTLNGKTFVGGLAGNAIVIKHSYANVTINRVEGAVGGLSSFARVTNSYATGTISWKFRFQNSAGALNLGGLVSEGRTFASFSTVSIVNSNESNINFANYSAHKVSDDIFTNNGSKSFALSSSACEINCVSIAGVDEIANINLFHDLDSLIFNEWDKTKWVEVPGSFPELKSKE